jgi:hypothetical protein
VRHRSHKHTTSSQLIPEALHATTASKIRPIIETTSFPALVDSERALPVSGRSYRSLAAGATSVPIGFIATNAVQRVTDFSVLPRRGLTLPACNPTGLCYFCLNYAFICSCCYAGLGLFYTSACASVCVRAFVRMCSLWPVSLLVRLIYDRQGNI